MVGRMARKHGKAARRNPTIVWVASLPFVVTLALVGYTLLADPLPASQQQPIASALRVSVDSESGELRKPTRRDWRRIAANASNRVVTNQPPTPQVVHRNGVTIVPLPGRFRTQVRVRKDAQGDLQVTHGVAGSHE